MQWRFWTTLHSFLRFALWINAISWFIDWEAFCWMSERDTLMDQRLGHLRPVCSERSEGLCRYEWWPWGERWSAL